MRVLLGLLIASVASAPAFAFLLGQHYRDVVPAPAPELAVGGVAVLAVIVTFVLARLAIRRRAKASAPAS